MKRNFKFGKTALKWLASPFFLGILFTFLISYTARLYYSNRSLVFADKDDHSLVALISQIHQKTIDWRLTDRGPLPGSDRVAILAIDERAVQQEGRFPWPRDKQARMVQRALEYGAKSVSFDIVYSEADETSAIPTLRKLKRNVARKSKAASSDILPMIESELRQIDGDQAFSNTLKTFADRMILGSFFDFDDKSKTPGFKDYCSDAVFERTAAGRYWQNENLKLTVIDKSFDELRFPSALKENLGNYLFAKEIQAAHDWFEEHPEISGKIEERLEEFGPALSKEAYPGIATLWLENDVAQTKTLLEQIKPDQANDQGVRRLFSLFGSAFTKQETSALNYSISKIGEKYCKEAFFTPKDELLSLEAYKKAWGESDDVASQYNAFSWQTAWNDLKAQRAPATDETLEQFLDRIRSQSPMNGITNADNWLVNIPLIADQTKHTGYFNAQLDSDGTVRRSFLMVRRGHSYIPSLALKQFLTDGNYTARATLGLDNTNQQGETSKVVKSFDILDSDQKVLMKIPVDQQGFLMINYSGAQKMFPHISAADILTDSPKMTIETRIKDEKTGRWSLIAKSVDKKEFLKDKLLIAGATATGIYDLRVTPFEENYPGVETHANVLSNLLIETARASGDSSRSPANTASAAPGFLRTHPNEAKIMSFTLVLLGLVMAALLTYFGSIAGLGITTATLGGIYAIDKYYFFKSGVVVTTFFPVIEVFGSYVTLTFYKYFTEERKKRELKGTFEKYVSPAIVAEVLSDPENIELGGKKMELTVMFSDVRGFTTISEKLDPRQLSDLLNSYLTPMTDLVFKNKGTLDKYMGDAIMAFWGAPIHFDDHAQHAARCALQMIEKLKALQEDYRAKGLPEIDIGIGLNTGDMSVGNMGSETVRSYTVMGDSVNLGSRLEGINKQYGTRIIISEFTERALKNAFVTREVDWVRVKGKAQPVRIYELICEGPAPSSLDRLLLKFNAGFQLYHEKKFEEAIVEFGAALSENPDDAVTQLYIERCQDYLKDPPPENWDGVFTMTSK